MTEPGAGRRAGRRRRRSSTGVLTAIVLVAAASALVAALSPARPTGARPADAVWCALAGAAIPLFASRARRWTLLWAGGVAAVVGVGGGALAVAGAVCLLVALGVVAWSARRSRVQGAIVGALAVNVVLRGPAFGFVGLPTLVALVAFAPLLWSGYRMARRRERRTAVAVAGALLLLCVVGAGTAAAAATRARDDLQVGADEAQAGLDQLAIGETADAADHFRLASERFGTASSALESPLLTGGRYVPIAGQQVDALRTIATSGLDLTTSAASTASTADYRTLTADAGRIDLERISSLQETVSESATVSASALHDVVRARTPWLVPQVATQMDRFIEKLRSADEQASLAVQGLTVAPLLLGEGRGATYFVAFATPSESRNGGGFVGAYGLLHAQDGNLELTASGDLNALNPTDAAAPYRFDPPPGWEERYGDYYVPLFLGNVAASPDWPTDVDVIRQLFPQTPGGTDVDGAIYVDPAGIAGLLGLTGPVEVPELGISLDASNAQQFLQTDQYVAIDGDNPQRKEILGDVARATFDALTSRPLPGLGALTDTLGPLVSAGHLRLSVADPEAEAFLDRIGLSGRWPSTEAVDYLSVRSADLLSNKIDAFLHRTITVRATVDPSKGTVHEEVTVSLRNDAPPDGLPRYVIGNERGLPSGTNVHLLTIHSPHRLTSVDLDGQAVAVAEQTELGGPAYSVPVPIEAGATRTVTFVLDGDVRSWPYTFEVRPQPTANPDVYDVEIQGVPGAENPLKSSGADADVVRLQE